jgi:site-specific recombinase XerC
MRQPPRTLEPEHRVRIRRQLKLEADAGRFNALRNRALYLLAWGSALRLKEVLALTVGQVLELEQPQPRRRVLQRRSNGAHVGRLEAPARVRWRVRSKTYLRVQQAKGGAAGADVDGRPSVRRWTSAGNIVITSTARRALSAYVKHAVKAGALRLEQDAPVWVRRKTAEPIRKRTLQDQWHGLQLRAGIELEQHYHFHCLRHDALTLFARACRYDVFQIAAFGRCDPYTAQRYVHAEPRRLAALADAAEQLR